MATFGNPFPLITESIRGLFKGGGLSHQMYPSLNREMLVNGKPVTRLSLSIEGSSQVLPSSVKMTPTVIIFGIGIS